MRMKPCKKDLFSSSFSLIKRNGKIPCVFHLRNSRADLGMYCSKDLSTLLFCDLLLSGLFRQTPNQLHVALADSLALIELIHFSGLVQPDMKGPDLS